MEEINNEKYCQEIEADKVNRVDEHIHLKKNEQNDEEQPFPSHATQNELQSSIETDNDKVGLTQDAEYARWHYRLGHMHPRKMQRLASLGYLPKHLEEIKHYPKCKICQFGKQHCTSSKVKGSKSTIFESAYPGQCVSVDQLVSSSKGFYGQLKGRLTRKRYKYATLFIDQYSRYSYLHLQSSLTSAETVQAKEAFESKSRDHGVRIEHYHADNGRFSDNAFRDHVKASGQSLSFCGVNAHWQNGVAEKGIWDIKETAQTMLLHAIDKWPGAITTFLWPYAMQHAVNVWNSTPFKHEDQSPMEKFSSTKIQPNLKHIHTFG